MKFQYQKARVNIEILNDLVMIQNERIAGYHMILESTAKEPHFIAAIRNVINDGLQFKYKLVSKLSQIEVEPAKSATLPGRLYGVWKDLKMKLLDHKRKEMIADCQYNEVIALHISNAALNYNELSPDNRALIESQEAVLKHNMSVIRQCSDTRHFNYPVLMYFN